RVEQRIAALPGVVSATASIHLLLSGTYRDNGLYVPGYSPQPNEKMHVRVVPAGSNFFQTMRLPLLRGRDFTGQDSDNAPKVAVVNETFASHYFPRQDPLGRKIAWKQNEPEMEIVG